MQTAWQTLSNIIFGMVGGGARIKVYIVIVMLASCFLPHHVTGNSQCEQTFINTGFGNYIVEAGVRTCFRCVFEGVEDPNTLWRIIDSNGLPAAINPSDGQVNGGVLTIFDPITIVPNTGVAFQNQRTLLCDRSFGGFLQYRNLLSRRGMHTHIHSLQHTQYQV